MELHIHIWPIPDEVWPWFLFLFLFLFFVVAYSIVAAIVAGIANRCGWDNGSFLISSTEMGIFWPLCLLLCLIGTVVLALYLVCGGARVIYSLITKRNAKEELR